MSCGRLLGCVAACLAPDCPQETGCGTACAEYCIARGLEEEVAKYNEVIACMNGSGCTDNGCVETKCAAPIAACQ